MTRGLRPPRRRDGADDACSADPGLLTIEEACAAAAAEARPIGDVEQVGLTEARGRLLAEEIAARVPLPAFDQSAMDGYAVALTGGTLQAGATLPLAGRVAAGEFAPPLAPGHATRILTGARLPAGAGAVVMQEKARTEGGRLLLDAPLRPGDNVRRRGEDVAVGDRLLRPGDRLDARHVALLAAQGLARVAVRRRPRIAILSTGSELRQPGETLEGAGIYDSNRFMIMALCDATAVEVLDGGSVPDEPRLLADALARQAAACDLVVTSGGAADGEEDHAAAAIRLAGGRARSLRVALKPGKPAVVGALGGCAVLGLPGNPVAALVSWLLLGRAVLAGLEGRPAERRRGWHLPSASWLSRRSGRTEFVPARLDGPPARPRLVLLARGGSARLRPLLEADGLAEIPAERSEVAEGDELAFHAFAGGFAL